MAQTFRKVRYVAFLFISFFALFKEMIVNFKSSVVFHSSAPVFSFSSSAGADTASLPKLCPKAAGLCQVHLPGRSCDDERTK